MMAIACVSLISFLGIPLPKSVIYVLVSEVYKCYFCSICDRRSNDKHMGRHDYSLSNKYYFLFTWYVLDICNLLNKHLDTVKALLVFVALYVVKLRHEFAWLRDAEKLVAGLPFGLR